MQPNPFDDLLRKPPFYKRPMVLLAIGAGILYACFLAGFLSLQMQAVRKAQHDLERIRQESAYNAYNLDIDTSSVSAASAESLSTDITRERLWTVEEPFSDVPQLLADFSGLSMGPLSDYHREKGRFEAATALIHLGDKYTNASPGTSQLLVTGKVSKQVEQVILRLGKINSGNRLACLEVMRAQVEEATEAVYFHLPQELLKKIAYGVPFEHSTVEGHAVFSNDGEDWTFRLSTPLPDAEFTGGK